MSEHLAIYILAGFLAASNIFWAYQCHNLLCKLMSRDFGEYQYYKLGSKESDKAPSIQDEEDWAELEKENESYLAELNGMFPK